MKTLPERTKRLFWIAVVLVSVTGAMTGVLKIVRADGSLYEKIKIFHLVLNFFRNEYVDPQSDSRLLAGAVNGMLSATGASLTNLLLSSLETPSLASNILPAVFNARAASNILLLRLSDPRASSNRLLRAMANPGDTSNVRPEIRSLFAEDIFGKLSIFNQCLNFVRERAVPRQDDEKLIYAAIDGMVWQLRITNPANPEGDPDPFTHFLRPRDFKDLQVETTGKFGGLGIYITIRDDKLMVQSPIPDTPASRAGLKAYDWIQKIDGESTKGLVIEDAMGKLRGVPGTRVTVSIMRDGFADPVDYTLVREVIKIESVVAKVMDPGNYGYIRIKQFGETTASDLENVLKDYSSRNLDGLILDLRGNPGGLLVAAWKIADMFLTSGLVVYTKGRTRESDQEFPADAFEYLGGMPMVVLVDRGSASASEIVTGALKDDKRATVVGERTFGKGIVQTVKQLDEGTAVSFTTAKYYTPSGVCIHGIGIEPNIEVKAPALTDEQVKSIQKVLDGRFVENFVRADPELLKRDPAAVAEKVRGLQDEIRAKGIEIDASLLARLVKIEAYRSDEFVYDLDTDVQLQRAVQFLKEKK
jgi:carboxyl-terminal processing protease